MDEKCRSRRLTTVGVFEFIDLRMLLKCSVQRKNIKNIGQF